MFAAATSQHVQGTISHTTKACNNTIYRITLTISRSFNTDRTTYLPKANGNGQIIQINLALALHPPNTDSNNGCAPT
jgi:hypothetical protein